MHILHLIDSLAFGGAERLLQGVVNGMPQHRHTVVYLYPRNDFGEGAFQAEMICLNYQGKYTVFRVIKQLKQLISTEEIHLIHSHLMLSTVIARLACPMDVVLLNSYHSLVHHPKSPQFRRFWLLLDRWTAKRRYHSLFVSQTAARYAAQHRQAKHILPNYVDDVFFAQKRESVNLHRPLQILVLGSLRAERNHQIVVDVLKKWPDLAVQVDFVGKGPLRASLQAQALELKQIRFCGFRVEVASLMGTYDLLLAPSRFEGFGLAVAEAMAVGLPILAADIPAFREVTRGHALFFDPEDKDALHRQIRGVLTREKDVFSLASKAQQRAQAFSKLDYLHKLDDLYHQLSKD